MKISKLFSIKNENIVLTGISGNLGYEYSRSLLENGCNLIGIDIKKSKNIILLEKKYKKKFLFIKCNITKISDIKLSIIKIKKFFKYPTVLINNAGIDYSPNKKNKLDNAIENFSEKNWKKDLSVNLDAVFYCCKLYGTLMKENKGGSIINISSIYGILAPNSKVYENVSSNSNVKYIRPISYSVSKSGVINLTRYLSEYWSKDNIRVNTLVLGGVSNKLQNPNFVKNYNKIVPIGRLANLDEYNGAIIFLASKASSYMTGSQIVIDGGWSAI